jgi:hypothetical protein
MMKIVSSSVFYDIVALLVLAVGVGLVGVLLRQPQLGLGSSFSLSASSHVWNRRGLPPGATDLSHQHERRKKCRGT